MSGGLKLKKRELCLKKILVEELFFKCEANFKKIKIKILTKNFINNSINGKCFLDNNKQFGFYKILYSYEDYISELNGYNRIKRKYKVPKVIDNYIFDECYVIIYNFLNNVESQVVATTLQLF